MSIKHLLFYIVRGTSSEALQKLLEMTPSNLKTERRTLKIFLQTFSIVSCLYPSATVWTHCMRNSVESSFFHIKSSLCCSLEVEIKRLRYGLWVGQGFLVLLLMTRSQNFSFRNSKATFVQCGGAPSCIHQSEERVAEWRSLGQIMSCSYLRYETPLTDDKWPSSSRNAWTIGTIPLIMATKFITLTSFLSFVSQIFWGFSSWSVRRSVL